MCLHSVRVTHLKKFKLPPQDGGRCHVVCASIQSGVSAHCDPVQKDYFTEGLDVINEWVELSAVLKVSFYRVTCQNCKLVHFFLEQKFVICFSIWLILVKICIFVLFVFYWKLWTHHWDTISNKAQKTEVYMCVLMLPTIWRCMDYWVGGFSLCIHSCSVSGIWLHFPRVI